MCCWADHFLPLARLVRLTTSYYFLLDPTEYCYLSSFVLGMLNRLPFLRDISVMQNSVPGILWLPHHQTAGWLESDVDSGHSALFLFFFWCPLIAPSGHVSLVWWIWKDVCNINLLVLRVRETEKSMDFSSLAASCTGRILPSNCALGKWAPESLPRVVSIAWEAPGQVSRKQSFDSQKCSQLLRTYWNWGSSSLLAAPSS